MFIPENSNSNEFVTAHSRAVADAFFVSADCKGVADLDERLSITLQSGCKPRSETGLSLACSCSAACSSRFFRRRREPELGRDALTRACLAQLTLRSAYHVQMKCPHCRVEFHDDPRQLSYSQMLWITG